MTILGVDFSHWQSKPDCMKLAAAGVKFAIVKAGEVLVTKATKPLYFDGQHDRNIIKLNEAGVICGDYYYYHPSAGASKQANHYAEIYNRMKPDLPPVIDVEDKDSLFPKDVAKQLLVFIDELKKRTGRQPIIYSRNGFLVNECGNPDWPDGTLFWIARYSNQIGDLSPKIKPNVIIWQFTDRIKLPGLPTMDGNYWLKSEDELKRLAGKVEIIPPVISNPLPGLEEVYFRMGIRSRWLERHIRGA